MNNPNYNERSTLVNNGVQLKCALCFLDLPAGLACVLRTCQHPFCFRCLQNALLNGNPEDYACPYSYKQFKCKAKLEPDELTYILKHSEASKTAGKTVNTNVDSTQKVAGESLEFWIAWVNHGLNELFRVLQQSESTTQGTAAYINCNGANPKVPSQYNFDCTREMPVKLTESESENRYSKGAIPKVPSGKTFDRSKGKSSNVEYVSKAASDKTTRVSLNRKNSKCLICKGMPQAHEEVTLHCFHKFCKQCLTQTVMHAYDIDVQCPAVLNGTTKCTAILLENEIRTLLSKDEYNKYLERCVQRADARNPNSVHCFKSKCPGWFEVDGYVDSFNCPVCSARNCVSCKAIHVGQTCKNYQDNLKLTKRNDTTNHLADQSYADLPSNHKNPKCLICNGASKAYEEVMLSRCLHIFCKPCLAETVKHAEDVVVQCPALLDGVTECTATLLDNEIRALLSKEEYNNYQKKCVQKAEADTPNSIHCLKPNCPGWIVADGYIDSFTCYVCSAKNCISCKAIHTGQTCKIYQDSLMPKDGTQNAFYLEVLSDTILPPNQVAFECPICNDNFQAYKEVVLSECFHMFCKNCLIQTVKHAEDAEVRCPALLDGAEKCTSILHDNEIRALLSAEDYNKYLQKGLQEAEAVIANTVHCLQPNCPGWIEAVGNLASFKCLVCSTENCITCKAIHADQTCTDYKATLKRKEEDVLSEKKLTNMVETREGMRCPKCGVMITKNGGCNSMQCAKCKTPFTWLA